MIDPVGENGQHRRIFLRCYVRYLQSAALGVNIGAGELGDFSDDIAAVIGKAGTQVFFFSGRSAVGLPVEGIDCQRVSAGGNHQGVGDRLCFAVKGDDDAGIVFTGGKAKMGILLQIFLAAARLHHFRHELDLGVATDFGDVVVSLVLNDLWRILVMLLPALLFALLARPTETVWKTRWFLLAAQEML